MVPIQPISKYKRDWLPSFRPSATTSIIEYTPRTEFALPPSSEGLLHSLLHLLSTACSRERRQGKTGNSKPCTYLFHDIKVRRFDSCDALARRLLNLLHLGPRVLVVHKVNRDTLATKASRSSWISRALHQQRGSSATNGNGHVPMRWMYVSISGRGSPPPPAPSRSFMSGKS